MPQRPDGAAARPQQVTFTKSAAERIAAAVRGYEAGDRGAEPLRFNVAATDSSRKVFRIATFTGSWATGQTKTVTYKYQTTTPNTANAVNLFVNVADNGTTQPVAIAKEGTAWYAVEFLRNEPFRMATFTGAWGIGSLKTVTLNAGGTVLVSNLLWPLPEVTGDRDCAIAQEGTSWYLVSPRMYLGNAATAATLSSAQLTFETLPFAALAPEGTATFSIAVDACESTVAE